MSDCAAIVLAAGASTRLGQPKQLLVLDGESLLRRTVKLARQAGCDPVFVVLGFEADRMQQELSDLETKIVKNQNWQSGMGSSLHCGIDALMRETPLPQRVLLLLCDQVKLSAEILLNLMRTGTEPDSLIAASSYAGRLGVPAVFDKQLYPDLLDIKDDQGARFVIQQYLNQATAVDFPDGAIDIDTLADLASLRNNQDIS